MAELLYFPALGAGGHIFRSPWSNCVSPAIRVESLALQPLEREQVERSQFVQKFRIRDFDVAHKA
jgi:hypothetical protein